MVDPANWFHCSEARDVRQRARDRVLIRAHIRVTSQLRPQGGTLVSDLPNKGRPCPTS